MAKKDFLSDLDCPQFVDFAAGLTEQDDVFFDSAKPELFCTPVSVIQRVGKRAVSTKFNKPASRPLFDKNKRSARITSTQMHPKTPKSSAESTKERLERSPCVNLERRSPYESTNERHSRRRSQSENNIDDAVKPRIGFVMPILRKRSLSADDVRLRRKVTYPTTPMCLKRPKRDKQIKTTEQLELEKIAELQKELSNHLRFNEMSMKRLGLKKRVNPCNELPVKTACMFKAPEPPREAEKLHPHKKPSAPNNLRKTDEEVRFKFRNTTAAAHFLAPPALRKDIGAEKVTKNLWSNSSTISCGSKSDAEKSMEVVPERAELKSKHFDFLAPPTLQKGVGAQKATRNVGCNSSTISCGSKSDAEKSIEVVPRRIELKSKHFDFLAPPTLQKGVCAQKETRNLGSNSSTISSGSKSDAEKSIEVIAKRTLLRNLNNSIHSCGSKADAEKSMEVVPKRALGVKNTGFHCGIKFSGNFQKVTIVKPFALEKSKEVNSKAVNEPCLPNPQNIPSTRKEKENVPLRTNTNDRGHKKKP